MSRIHRCDGCGAHLDNPRQVRVLRAYTLPDDEGAPFRDARIGDRRVVHLCVGCFEGVAARATADLRMDEEVSHV